MIGTPVKTVCIENLPVTVYSNGRLEIQLTRQMNSDTFSSWRDRNCDELAELKAPYVKASVQVFNKKKPKWNFLNTKGRASNIK